MIETADLDAPDVVALLDTHIGAARQQSATHALDREGLRAIELWALRDDAGALMGLAGLKTLDHRSGEIKSVRTHADHLRKGVAARLMAHIEGEARRRGWARLLLETHPTPPYAAARALYERRGYTYRGPFEGYENTPESVFMELAL